MARCSRCDSCECMWDMTPCNRCNFPHADTRTEEEIVIDDADYSERMGDLECNDI